MSCGALRTQKQVCFNGVLYTYIHNLQGDIVGLLDNSGALVVEYKYDAWGKLISTTGTLADTLGRRNPFRYRGYVYDEETGLYYLRSRYYNPTVGRFVNADTLLGNVGALGSHNAFAYCVNNPIAAVDPDGQEAIALGLGFLACAAIYCIAAAVYCGSNSQRRKISASNNASSTSSSSRSSSSSSSSKTVAEDLGSIAGAYGNFQCVNAKDAMLEYLLSQNLHGTIIELRFPSERGYVYSNSHNMTISKNGYHVGIEYEGIVYCNVHPEGLPESLWISDFEDWYGICPPENITRIAF